MGPRIRFGRPAGDGLRTCELQGRWRGWIGPSAFPAYFIGTKKFTKIRSHLDTCNATFFPRYFVLSAVFHTVLVFGGMLQTQRKVVF